MSNVVVLSPEELRAIVREAVADALRDVDVPREPDAPITDDDRAAMRKRFRSMGRKR